MPRSAATDRTSGGRATQEQLPGRARAAASCTSPGRSGLLPSRDTCTSLYVGAVADARYPTLRALLVLLLLLVTPFTASCWLSQNKLQAVKAAGELVVLTRISSTTYYESPEGLAGFEYDLARAFADHLGVRLRLIVADKSADILPRLARGEADIAAAGLTATESLRWQMKFTPPYQDIRQQVVYRLGSPRPASVQDLIGRQIEVHAGTGHAERLTALKQRYPALEWSESEEHETETLLQMVWEGLLEITIADSSIVALNRQFFPELQVAFDLQQPEPLVWALPPGDDNSLHDAVAQFLEKIRASGELNNLLERYYGPASRSNFINLTVYQVRLQSRLPLFQKFFEDAGRKHGLDWRLLAAIGYQESFLDPKAQSPTGVRGLMMLTEETAKQMNVTDLLDPQQSIDGGARYVRHLIDRLPERIVGPDRLWLALAAYNIGLYHLEDARVLTQEQGGDPDRWNDVKQRLPLLADPAWAAKVKYGRARGQESVVLVNHVRTYYDVLVKQDEEAKAGRSTGALKLKLPAL